MHTYSDAYSLYIYIYSVYTSYYIYIYIVYRHFLKNVAYVFQTQQKQTAGKAPARLVAALVGRQRNMA